MSTIGEVIYRIKKSVKAVHQDAFLTDRLIYSLFMKHAKVLMRRQDSANKISKFNSIYQTVDYMELIEVDKVEAKCTGIKSCCTIKRTKYELPEFVEGYWGPMIRAVTSIDGSESLQPTYPTSYIDMTKQTTFKYNKTKYYWFINNHLYFPDLEWDAVRIEGVFEGDINYYNCECCPPLRQEQQLNIPEFLESEIERLIKSEDFGIMLQVPSDNLDDNKNTVR